MDLKTGFIPAGIEHQIYFEDVGDPTKQPLLFLHGGPGNGCDEKHRMLFDLDRYRVLLVDQRGSNRSQPLGCISDNTTDFIIQDIETLRRRLKIEKLTLVGSSWGAIPAI